VKRFAAMEQYGRNTAQQKQSWNQEEEFGTLISTNPISGY
jgi:hypothetical protein